MSKPTTTEIHGDVSGQVGAGERVTQVGDVHSGGQVIVAETVTYQARPRSFLASLFTREERMHLTPAQQRRNRENLLRNIKATWIDGFLHNAVHHAIYMELGIEYKRDAVSRPWDLTLQPIDQPIPHDKPIGAVFEEHGRSLLILGDPASGKTITMLQLAEELLVAAQEDESCPIPIILNLSSWARERQLLADWLLDELFIAYQVARPLARAWLETNQLTLLLDGLDEVDTTYRDDCITAINQFKASRPVDIVVCSRSADYEKLSNRLNLSTAVCIQPLTLAQIDAYLRQFGPRTDDVRAALPHDPDLQQLAQSPPHAQPHAPHLWRPGPGADSPSLLLRRETPPLFCHLRPARLPAPPPAAEHPIRPTPGVTLADQPGPSYDPAQTIHLLHRAPATHLAAI